MRTTLLYARAPEYICAQLRHSRGALTHGLISRVNLKQLFPITFRQGAGANTRGQMAPVRIYMHVNRPSDWMPAALRECSVCELAAAWFSFAHCVAGKIVRAAPPKSH